MKKLIPIISPFVTGLFGGLFVECTMCVLATVVSPFSDVDRASFPYLLLFLAVLAALITVAVVIVNTVYLVNLNDKSKIKATVILEALACIATFFITWSFWNTIIDKLYQLL